MISYLDNLNQSQLPRVWGCLLKLAQADSFYRSHFLQTFPVSPPPTPHINPVFVCLVVALLPSQAAAFWRALIFSCVYKLGFVHCPYSPSQSESLLNEIIYVPTPCTWQTHECYLSSFFSFPKMPRLKLLFCQMEGSIL